MNNRKIQVITGFIVVERDTFKIIFKLVTKSEIRN